MNATAESLLRHLVLLSLITRVLEVPGAAVAERPANQLSPSLVSYQSSTIAGVPLQVPTGSASQLGERLTGVGTRLRPPTSPSSVPYTSDCQQLVDAAFAGKCIIAAGPSGDVAGVVEVEKAVPRKLRQERDLVWRQDRHHWALVEVYVTWVCVSGRLCGASPGLPAQLWSDDLARDGNADLVFVLPSDRAGFGSELDVVDEAGKVSLYRYLGGGFALVPNHGGLVVFTPGASEANPADEYFDQVFIRWQNSAWRLVSDQYVPYAAAFAEHRGAFYDPSALPAKA
jgi:hypothetical protein